MQKKWHAVGGQGSRKKFTGPHAHGHNNKTSHINSGGWPCYYWALNSTYTCIQESIN